MGLDNIPHNYPCKSGGTAVLTPRLDREGKAFVEEDGSPALVIDCKATQEAGGCPWYNDESRPTDGGVIGMFGTDCWYRGKHGNELLENVLGISYDETEGISFYGSNEDGSYKSPQECLKLATFIEDAIADTEWVADPSTIDCLETGIEAAAIEEKDYCVYAAWWLRWVAENADGTDCWY